MDLRYYTLTPKGKRAWKHEWKGWFPTLDSLDNLRMIVVPLKGKESYLWDRYYVDARNGHIINAEDCGGDGDSYYRKVEPFSFSLPQTTIDRLQWGNPRETLLLSDSYPIIIDQVVE